jgi:hypothetical protein
MSAVERWLFAPAPPARLATLRVLVGAYAVIFLLVRWEHLWSGSDLPRRQWEPVGVLGWLEGPISGALAHGAMFAAVPLGLAFTAGVAYRITGPAFALVFLFVTTYRLSFGHVIHTEHLLVAHLLILGFAPAAAVLAWRASGRSGAHAEERFGWPVQVMALVTVVAYVLAGIAKLRNGGTDWLVGDVLRNQVAFDNLRKELLGAWHSPVGGWSVRFDWIFPPLAVATVLVELGAPVAFLRGRWRTVWVGCAWLFHVGIALLMWISFPYQLLGLAYAPFFRVERLTTLLPAPFSASLRAKNPVD